MFLSSLGLLSSSLVAHFAVRVGGFELPNQARMTRQTYLTTIVPVGICQAATLALGNAVYMFLTVSFIQMLKAFTPVMVLVVGILFQVEAPEAAVSETRKKGKGIEPLRRREPCVLDVFFLFFLLKVSKKKGSHILNRFVWPSWVFAWAQA